MTLQKKIAGMEAVSMCFSYKISKTARLHSTIRRKHAKSRSFSDWYPQAWKGSSCWTFWGRGILTSNQNTPIPIVLIPLTPEAQRAKTSRGNLVQPTQWPMWLCYILLWNEPKSRVNQQTTDHPTNLLDHLIKSETRHPNIIFIPKWKFTPSDHLRCELVSSWKPIWWNEALHHLLTSGSSAVNGCRQNESPHIW